MHYIHLHRYMKICMHTHANPYSIHSHRYMHTYMHTITNMHSPGLHITYIDTCMHTYTHLYSPWVLSTRISLSAAAHVWGSSSPISCRHSCCPARAYSMTDLSSSMGLKTSAPLSRISLCVGVVCVCVYVIVGVVCVCVNIYIYE